MAKIDDCLKKLRAGGVVLDSKDEAQIRAWVETGVDPMAAVRRLYIERSKNVIDILGRARSEGAPITAYKDTYTEIVAKRSTMLERTFQSYQDEHKRLQDAMDESIRLAADIEEVQVALAWFFQATENRGRQIRTANEQAKLEGQEGWDGYIETTAERRARIRAAEADRSMLDPNEGLQSLARMTDEELLRVFEIMEFQDTVRARAGETLVSAQTGIRPGTAQEMLAAYRTMVARSDELRNISVGLRNAIARLERRADTIFSGETRNPDFGPLDSDGNYNMAPDTPDGVAEDVIARYRAYRGQHGEPQLKTLAQAFQINTQAAGATDLDIRMMSNDIEKGIEAGKTVEEITDRLALHNDYYKNARQNSVDAVFRFIRAKLAGTETRRFYEDIYLHQNELDAGGLIQTRAPTIAFARDRKTANLYAMSPNDRNDIAVAPRVIIADLEMKKPWRPNDEPSLAADVAEDPFIDLGTIFELGGLELVQELMKDLDIVSAISNTSSFQEFVNNELPESYQGDESLQDIVATLPQESWEGLYGDGWRFLSNPALVEALKKEGYDGVVIGGTGDNALMTEYHVFSADQVKMPGAVKVLQPDGIEETPASYGRLPWNVASSKTATGDLYIRRHGANAGKVFRERQSENDLVLSVDQSVLLPDFMYYLMQYLQPRIAGRARGSVQQYISKNDINDVLIEHFQSQVREDAGPPKKKRASRKKGSAIVDKNVPAARREAEARMNYKAVIGLVEEKSLPIGLTHVKTAEDAAHVVAPIRKNAQEGMWGIVLDENDKVLGLIEHSKGDISGSSVSPSIMAGHILQVPGARKVWFAHNHPSGITASSNADEVITRKMVDLMGGSSVEVQGHVIVGAGRDRFTQLGPDGMTTTHSGTIRPMVRNSTVPVYNRKYTGKPTAGAQLGSPADGRRVIGQIGIQEGLILLDNRHRVLGVLEMTDQEMRHLRGTGQLDRVLLAAVELNAAAFVSVTLNASPEASSNMATLASVASGIRHLDHMYRDRNGRLSSVAELGLLRGNRTFNQDIIGMTSGLLEAAKNMPQAKGPAAQMLGVLKNMPGVTLDEINAVELEDWLNAKGYVTRDEIIDFVDKNGVRVDEFHFVDDAMKLEQIGLNVGLINPRQISLNWQPNAQLQEGAIEWLQQHPAYLAAVERAKARDRHFRNELILASDVFAVTVQDTGRHYVVIADRTASGVTGNVWVLDLDYQTTMASPLRTAGVANLADAWLLIKATALREAEAEGRRPATTLWDIRGTPRHTSQTLDGGMNHREVVFRLMPPASDPARIKITGEVILPPDSDSEYMDSVLTQLRNVRNMDVDKIERVTDQIISLTDLTSAEWAKVEIALDLGNHLDMGVTLHELGRVGDPKKPAYTQSHAYTEWDNILLWARVNERVGPNGERILFIEEIQSDWHQNGRKHGYLNYDEEYQAGEARIQTAIERMEQDREVALPGLVKMRQQLDRLVDQGGTYSDYGRYGGSVDLLIQRIAADENWVKTYERHLGEDWMRDNLTQLEIHVINRLKRSVSNLAHVKRMVESTRRQFGNSLSLKPPDGPFKGTAWAELAMKRIIRLAAEKGFDQVAWTTGEQQADRYNLRRVTDFINWNPVTETLEAQGFNEKVPAERLEQYVGVEIANNLRQQSEPWMKYDIVPAEDAGIRAGDLGVYRQVLDNIDEAPDKIVAGFVAVDVDGEYVRDSYGDILFDRHESALDDMVQAKIATEFTATVQGDDLEVGGQGMKEFYDKILVNLANKAAKKYDKGLKVQKFKGLINGASQTDINAAQEQLDQALTDLKVLDYEERTQVMILAQGELRGRYERQRDGAIARLRSLENEWHAVHVMDITPKLQGGVLKGQTLFQKRQGSITFDENNRAIIRMTRARDMSTFLHESGHMYLELMADMAQMPGASEQAVGDYNKILKFLGVESREEIRREHHETFARAFEAYLREGKTPDPALRDIFQAFSAWLRQIYKQFKQLDVKLTPEIRGVFDRMIATDAAIREAESIQNYVDLFASAEDMGVSPEAFDVYRRTAAEAHEEAVMQEQRKLLEAQTRAAETWWKDERAKVEATVREEAYASPVYRALALLQNGTNPDGTVPGTSTFKLSKKSLLRALSGSQETLNRLPGRGKHGIYSAKGGVDVDIAARQFGYSNGLEMLAEILRSVPVETFIRQETDARMAQMFPDPLVSGELQANAMAAVHSDKRAQVMAAEMRAILKKIKEDRPIVEAHRRADQREQAEAKATLPKREELGMIRAAARQLIAGMRVRDVKPSSYLAAEQRAGRLAFEALGRKDYEKAYQHKRQQLVNHEMYRAAAAAVEAAEKHRTYLARFDRKALRQRMGKGGVLDRIDEALEAFNFRKIALSQVDRERAQKELMEAIDSGVIAAPQSLIQKLRDRGQNYQDLTIEELQGLRDIVAQLEKMGRAHFEALVMGEKKNIQDTAASLVDVLNEQHDRKPLNLGDPTRGETVKDSMKSGLWNFLRPGAIARLLDNADYGRFTEVLIEPIRRAYTERMLPWFVKMEEEVAAIYRKHYDDSDLQALNNQRVHIQSLGEAMTRGNLVALALNWGNEGNRHAVLNGKDAAGRSKYPPAAVREMLSHLTAKDWAFVQDVWDYMGSYYHDKKDAQGNVIREGIATVEKRRRGIAPKQVEALPFTIRTADGIEVDLRGGYYPLAYDPKFSSKQRKLLHEDLFEKMATGSFVRAQTRAGSTHERVQNHGKVVQLRLGMIDRHLREVIRDIAIGDEVNFVKRVLDDPNFGLAMQETRNHHALIQLNRWLADSAVGELPAASTLDHVVSYVRTGFTKAKLGWNLTTMMLQVTGFARTAAVIGTTKMMYGLGKYMQSPIDNWKFILESSAFMTQRYVHQSWNKDVMDTQAHLQAMPWLGVGPTRSRRFSRTFARTLFVPIMAAQSQVDAITWMAVYQDKMNEHQDHKKATLQADAMVEMSQTSGFFSDRSALERGTVSEKTVQAQFVRLWTTLISYMMAGTGIAFEKGSALKKSYQRDGFSFGKALRFASDMMMLFAIEGVLAALIYGKMPDWDEEEDESMLGWTAKQGALSFISGVPFAREALAMQYGGGNTPIGGLFADMADIYVASSWEAVKTGDGDLLKAINNVGGTLFHYPSTQTNRIIDTAWSEHVEGEDRPWTEYLTGRRGNE